MSERRHSRATVLARMRLEIRRSRQVTVYVLGFLALTVFASVLLLSRSTFTLPGSDPATFRVAVDDAKGVAPGKDEVRWAGVPVGTITDVKLRGAAAVLTVKIARDELPGDLYRNARASLRPQTALNDMFLDIEERGTAEAGKLGQDDVLQGERTQVAVNTADVLNVFSEDTRDRMRQLLRDLSVGLDDHGAQLRSAFARTAPWLRGVSRFAGVLSRRRAVVRSLTHALRTLTDELGTREQALTGLVRDGSRTFAGLGGDSAALDRFVRSLAPTLARTRTSMTRLAATAIDLRPAVEALEPAVAALPGGLSGLQRFAQTAGPTFTALRPTAGALRPLARRLGPAADAIGDAAASIDPQTGRLQTIVEDTSKCREEIEAFPTATIQTFKLIEKDTRTGGPRGNFVFTGNELPDPLVPNIRVTGCADGKPGYTLVPHNDTLTPRPGLASHPVPTEP